jgi:GNAT superfamily N-acetyltransferase
LANIQSRMFIEQDKEELNDLYNLVAGRARELPQFEWEWLNTPEGWGNMWLLVDADSGKIVGHHGMIPVRFSYCGKDILTGKTENTVMHPQYRGKGIYTPFEAKFIQEARDRFGMAWTTAGAREQGRIRLKVGYSIIGEYANFFRVIRWLDSGRWVSDIVDRLVQNKYIARLLVWAYRLVSIFLMPFFWRRRVTDKQITLEKIADIDIVSEEWDAFWERNRDKFGVTIDRNSRYLKWRIFDNPNLTSEFFLARRDGEITGYVVTRDLGDRGKTIVDLVARDNDPIIVGSILNCLADVLKKEGFSVVHMVTLRSGNMLNKTLKRSGYICFHGLEKFVRKIIKNRASVLMAKVLDESLDKDQALDPAGWYFTEIFGEGRER